MKKLAILLMSAILFTLNTNGEGRFDELNKFYSANFLADLNLIPQTVFVVNTAGDQNDALPGDGFCNDGSGNCSLRAAIQESNAFPGANIIDFNIPDGCFLTITPTTALPDITDSVTINGYSQPDSLPNTAVNGSNAKICVSLSGSAIGGFTDGLRINAVNTTVRGLNIRNWTDAGIEVGTGNGSIIEGNFIGTNVSGTAAAANRFGILIFANNVRVGGTTLLSRNILSGNTRFGVSMTEPASGNIVQNNYVGLGAGSGAIGNGQTGVQMFRSSANTIGGTTANVRNVISGNGFSATGGTDGSGVYILGDLISNSPNNLIQGNYIGTDPTGTTAIPNALNGVTIFGGINTTVGGTASGARNVISGNNQSGVRIENASATGNLIQGNYIGLSASGTADLGNVRDGVQVLSSGNTVGGTVSGAGNYVSGNEGDGIYVNGGGVTNNFVQGNFVGTNAAGTSAIGNGFAGIEINSTNNNTVGGTTAGARNYVAGNNFFGIVIAFNSGNVIQGNYVGISAAGNTFSNGTGIHVQDAANNTIGGTVAGAGNLISGNTNFGIRLVQFTTGFPVTGNLIQGNQIGTNAAGTAAVPNNIGVLIQVANANTVGGTVPEARNIISGNTTSGIDILNTNDSIVQGNYIGTTLDGISALPNGGNGIQIATSGGGVSQNNVIGGTAAGAGNLLSGNLLSGVIITGSSSNNRVEGNVSGLNAAGNALANGNHGVSLSGGGVIGNVVGGNTAGAGNILSGNAFNGVLITNGASGNTVAGNRIGTNAAGTNARSNNGNGVHILNASNNTIGGADSSYRNLITANNAGGVRISGTSTGNFIRANYIGSNAAGNNYLQNAAGTDITSNFNYGILIESPNNTIGGNSTDYRNLISGHFFTLVPGIRILSGGTGTVVQNNYIGTTADGNSSLFNGQGIECAGSNFNFDSNLISGSLYGINISNVTNGYITNNLLGTNADGTSFLGNGFSIAMQNASSVWIGQNPLTQVAPNVIAGGVGNNRAGITITGNGTGNLIRQNSIYENGGIGIDLGGDGVSQNDPNDSDLANNLQNFPVITNVMTNIEGTLNSTPNRSFRIEFYSSPTADPTGYGEGKTFITNTVVNTDGSGNTSFSIPNPIPLGSFISATATDLVTNDTSEFSAYKQVLAPTAVKFAGAKAVKYNNGVWLQWETGFESDNLGFNVYRETKGGRELVNNSLISGSALLTRAKLQSGFEYGWFDASANADAVYYIESVDLDGSKEIFGAFRAESFVREIFNPQNSKTLAELNRTNEQQTVLVEPQATIETEPKEQQISSQTIVASNEGITLKVKNANFYRVSAQTLFANGLPDNVNPNNLALFADGIEQPLNIVLSEEGMFEGIEFYGIGIDSTEANARSYQLIVSSNPSRRIEKINSPPGAPSNIRDYTASVERRDRTTYFSGLLNGEEENFFGTVINSGGVGHNLAISNLAADSDQNAEITVKLQGLTNESHSVRVEINGQFIDDIAFQGLLKGNLKKQFPANLLRNGKNTVRLISLNGTSDLSLVENIRLSFPRALRAVNNSILFTAESGSEVMVEGFTIKSARVFDVTDANNVFELNTRAVKNQVDVNNIRATNENDETNSRSYNIGVTPVGVGTRNLLAIAKGAEVAGIEKNFASDLRNEKGADLLIITKREFFGAAERLAKLRESQDLRVQIVDIQDIYDEFGFSQKSSRAVKDFLQFASVNYQIRPQYVLFAGDASYDPKGYIGGFEDIIPTRLVDTMTIETASDEWFGDFNDDGAAEVAIGRLPALNAEELNVMVEKLIRYESQPVSNSMTFVSDLSDGFDFVGANSAVREILPTGLNVNDIRRDELNNENVKSQILDAFNNGQKMITYVGHGSTLVWRGNVFTRNDAQNLTNANRLPVVITMTCLNGFFHDAVLTGLSETLLKNPNGGAVAVWTSPNTGLPDSYGGLNVELHRYMLNGATLGQAQLAAKQTVANQDLLKTWVLLGDPSMRLR